MTEKITMAAVWEELSEDEKKTIAMMMGIDVGQMALAKISTVLKGIMYRYHDKPERLVEKAMQEQVAKQMQIERQRIEYDLKRVEKERMFREQMRELQKSTYQAIGNKRYPFDF